MKFRSLVSYKLLISSTKVSSILFKTPFKSEDFSDVKVILVEPWVVLISSG